MADKPLFIDALAAIGGRCGGLPPRPVYGRHLLIYPTYLLENKYWYYIVQDMLKFEYGIYIGITR